MIIAPRLAFLLGVFGLLAACSGDDPAADENDSMDPSDRLAAPADVAAPPADAEFTDSGLAWKQLAEGTGLLHPSPSSTVRVHYTGWQTSGRRFDSSRDGPMQPIEFDVDGVIDGWTEGLQLMVEGEERRFWIPEELAYKGNLDPRFPMGMLVFDVELIDILRI